MRHFTIRGYKPFRWNMLITRFAHDPNRGQRSYVCNRFAWKIHDVLRERQVVHVVTFKIGVFSRLSPPNRLCISLPSKSFHVFGCLKPENVRVNGTYVYFPHFQHRIFHRLFSIFRKPPTDDHNNYLAMARCFVYRENILIIAQKKKDQRPSGGLETFSIRSDRSVDAPSSSTLNVPYKVIGSHDQKQYTHVMYLIFILLRTGWLMKSVKNRINLILYSTIPRKRFFEVENNRKLFPSRRVKNYWSHKC